MVRTGAGTHRGPGRRNGHIPAGKVLKEFGADCLDPTIARQILYAAVHPEGPQCPHCKHHPGEPKASHWWYGRRVFCEQCGRYYTATTATDLHKCKMPPAQLVLLIVCLALELSTGRIADLVGVSRDTVCSWRERLR